MHHDQMVVELHWIAKSLAAQVTNVLVVSLVVVDGIARFKSRFKISLAVLTAIAASRFRRMLSILVDLEKSFGGEFVLALVTCKHLIRLVNEDDVFVEVELFSEGPFAQGAVIHRLVVVLITPRRVFLLQNRR